MEAKQGIRQRFIQMTADTVRWHQFAQEVCKVLGDSVLQGRRFGFARATRVEKNALPRGLRCGEVHGFAPALSRDTSRGGQREANGAGWGKSLVRPPARGLWQLCPSIVDAGALQLPLSPSGVGRVTIFRCADGMLVKRPLGVEGALATQANVGPPRLPVAPEARATSRYLGPRTASIVRVVNIGVEGPPAADSRHCHGMGASSVAIF